MIYQNLNLSDEDSKRVVSLVSELRREDAQEIAELEAVLKSRKLDRDHARRLAELKGRRKYITKSNLMKIFVLRGLGELERGLSAEGHIEQMVQHGSARGRPDGR